MNDEQFLKALIERGSQCRAGYFETAHLAACVLPKRLHESLEQLVNGPVWDGDVIAKSHRDELVDIGLGIRVCCGGEQGYTGATYFAYTVLKAIREIKEGKRAA